MKIPFEALLIAFVPSWKSEAVNSGRSVREKKPTFHFPLNLGKPWSCRRVFFKNILEASVSSLSQGPGYLSIKKTKQKRNGSQNASSRSQLQLSLELVLPSPRSGDVSSSAGRGVDLWHMLRERARGGSAPGTRVEMGRCPSYGQWSTPKTTAAADCSSFISTCELTQNQF